MKTAEIYLTLGGRDGRIANVRATEQFYQFSPSSRRRRLEILEVSPFAIREVSDMWTMLRKYEKDGGLLAMQWNEPLKWRKGASHFILHHRLW